MQDKAIQARTELRLNTELQNQEQKLAEFKLEKEKQRIQLSMSR